MALRSADKLISGTLGFLHLLGAFPGPLLRPLNTDELGEGGDRKTDFIFKFL